MPRFIGDNYWAASEDAEVDEQDRQEQANELRSALAELDFTNDHPIRASRFLASGFE